MSTMTGLGRYQMGIALEKDGLSAAEIAKRCGYKDAQAWHSSKHYYRRRDEALQQMATPKTANDSKPAPILEGLRIARQEKDTEPPATPTRPPIKAPDAAPAKATPKPMPIMTAPPLHFGIAHPDPGGWAHHRLPHRRRNAVAAQAGQAESGLCALHRLRSIPADQGAGRAAATPGGPPP